MKLTHLFYSLILLINFQVFAQNNTVKGIVKDSITNETIPGATVIIEGTNFKMYTSFDGDFMFNKVPKGSYLITIKYNGYTNYEERFTVDHDQTVEINAALASVIQQIGTMHATAKGLKKGSQEDLAKEQKDNVKVSDGISEASMKSQPTTRASDALGKVSGASIQDNKFVIVRGLNDRYNAPYLNGAPLPSSESDKKAFTFDIFPSNMLSSLVIYKSSAADQPGEFAGGIINVATKAPKDTNYQTFSVGTSINTLTTFQTFKDYTGSNTDWLGFDNQARKLPSSIPNSYDFSKLLNSDKADLAKTMTPSWAINSRTALPALNLQLGVNRHYQFKKRSFGFYGAYNYRNDYSTQQSIRREFEESTNGVVQRSELTDTNYTSNVLNSGMLNFELKWNKHHKFHIYNIYSVNSSDLTTVRKGIREMDNDPHIYEKASNRWYTQNNLYAGQLVGQHDFFHKKFKLDWVGGFSNIQREVPNMRRMVYQKTGMTEDDPSSEYTAIVQNNGTIPTSAGNMTWLNTKENIYSFKYDVTFDVTKKTQRKKDEEKENDEEDHNKRFKLEAKVGGMHQFRNRDFTARNFGFSRYKGSGFSFDNSLLTLPEDQIFSSEHLGLMSNGLGGFKLEEATKVSDSYQASSLLNSGYLMFDAKIMKSFKVNLGARIESYNQKFNYIDFGSNLEQNIDTTVVDILPSASVIYSITKKMNVRASYAKTLSRPEFRELAPFAFYNFAMDNIISGNPNLKRATIDNFDLRYEVYPGSGQMFTITGFYKNFQNPIEMIMRPGTSGAPELYYTNVPHVTSNGLELEYRIKLDVFSKDSIPNKFLSNTTLYANAAIIKSKVDVSEVVGSNYDERPLQGQSPYIINTGIIYNSEEKGWNISLSYNVVGRRIYLVGNSQEPDVWEKERHRFDFQIRKSFKNNLEITFNVRDILAQKQLFYQDLNGNKKYDKGTDNRWQEVTYGQTFGLTLGYKF